MFIYRLAEKHGVKLVYKQSFADFFDQHVQDRDHKNLLGRMKALEVRWFVIQGMVFLNKGMGCCVIFVLSSLKCMFRDVSDYLLKDYGQSSTEVHIVL